ncbi:MAG TPA: MCE family protein [Acidimicrobiales bacterium]
MVVSTRIKINLVVFFVAAAALAAYGYISVLHNPFKHDTDVVAYFPSTAGLREQFYVTNNGLVVGAVKSVQLTGDRVKVTMAIQPGQHIANNVQAQVVRANPLGEQAVDLVPPPGAPSNATSLRNGAIVPTSSDPTPPDVGQVVNTANRLFGAIPTGDLNTFVHELAVALNGRGDDIHTLISAGDQLAQELNANQAQFQTLLNNAPPFFDTLSANGPAFNQALANTEVLTQVLAQHSHDIVNLLNNGATASSVIQQLVQSSRPNLACLTHDLADFTNNIAQPANLANLATVFSLDTQFATNLQRVGYHQYPLGPNAPSPGPTEQLRIHLLLPPPQGAGADFKVARNLPPAYLAPGCNTEYGAGVGPATQSTPPQPPEYSGSPPQAAPASASQVRGGGQPVPGPGVPSAAHLPSEGWTGALPLMLLVVLSGAALVRRRPRMEDFRVPGEKLNRRDSIVRPLNFLRRTSNRPLDGSQT